MSAEIGPDADSPDIQGRIAAYFQTLHEFMDELVAPLALADREKAALQMLSLVQGSMVMAQATTDRSLAAANREAARLLLETVPRLARHAERLSNTLLMQLIGARLHR